MTLPINIGLDIFGSQVATLGSGGIDGSGGGLLAVIDLTASDATADFVDVWTDELDEYQFSWVGVQPATDDVYLHILASTDAGSSWLGGTTYGYGLGIKGSNEATVLSTGSSGGTTLPLIDTVSGNMAGNATLETCCGYFYIAKMSDTSKYKIVHGQSIWFSPDGKVYGATLAGSIKTTSAINGIRFAFSSGNFNKGKIKLRGKKAVV